MKVKAVGYLANILPDGHLSIPDEIRKKLKHTTKKKVKVSIEIEAVQEVNKKHPAFGIWANRFSGGSSKDEQNKIERELKEYFLLYLYTQSCKQGVNWYASDRDKFV